MNASDPLTHDEHELARLLGRPLGDGPGTDVDARILALARQAVAPSTTAPASLPARTTTPATSRHRRRRLGSSLAVAASLVLVVGLAWQLRPVAPPAMPELGVADATAPATPPAPAATPPATATMPAPALAPAEATEAPVAREQAAPAARATAREGTHQQPARQTAPPQRPLPPAPAPAVAPEMPLPPPSPPAPPAAASYAIQIPAEVQDEPAPPADAMRFSEAPARAASPTLDRVQVTGSRVKQTVETATIADTVAADALLSRRQWLQRIRERRDGGDEEAARASLQRFVQAHPHARIPRDLRPLLPSP